MPAYHYIGTSIDAVPFDSTRLTPMASTRYSEWAILDVTLLTENEAHVTMAGLKDNTITIQTADLMNSNMYSETVLYTFPSTVAHKNVYYKIDLQSIVFDHTHYSVWAEARYDDDVCVIYEQVEFGVVNGTSTRIVHSIITDCQYLFKGMTQDRTPTAVRYMDGVLYYLNTMISVGTISRKIDHFRFMLETKKVCMICIRNDTILPITAVYTPEDAIAHVFFTEVGTDMKVWISTTNNMIYTVTIPENARTWTMRYATALYDKTKNTLTPTTAVKGGMYIDILDTPYGLVEVVLDKARTEITVYNYVNQVKHIVASIVDPRYGALTYKNKINRCFDSQYITVGPAVINLLTNSYSLMPDGVTMVMSYGAMGALYLLASRLMYSSSDITHEEVVNLNTDKVLGSGNNFTFINNSMYTLYVDSYKKEDLTVAYRVCIYDVARKEKIVLRDNLPANPGVLDGSINNEYMHVVYQATRTVDVYQIDGIIFNHLVTCIDRELVQVDDDTTTLKSTRIATDYGMTIICQNYNVTEPKTVYVPEPVAVNASGNMGLTFIENTGNFLVANDLVNTFVKPDATVDPVEPAASVIDRTSLMIDGFLHFEYLPKLYLPDGTVTGMVPVIERYGTKPLGLVFGHIMKNDDTAMVIMRYAYTKQMYEAMRNAQPGDADYVRWAHYAQMALSNGITIPAPANPTDPTTWQWYIIGVLKQDQITYPNIMSYIYELVNKIVPLPEGGPDNVLNANGQLVPTGASMAGNGGGCNYDLCRSIPIDTEAGELTVDPRSMFARTMYGEKVMIIHDGYVRTDIAQMNNGDTVYAIGVDLYNSTSQTTRPVTLDCKDF